MGDPSPIGKTDGSPLLIDFSFCFKQIKKEKKEKKKGKKKFLFYETKRQLVLFIHQICEVLAGF
jgi:hypothetical protein